MIEIKTYNRMGVAVIILVTISISFLSGLRNNISTHPAANLEERRVRLQRNVTDYFYFIEPLSFNFDILQFNPICFNQLDSAKMKTGLWIESDGRDINTMLTHYHKNTYNGLKQIYGYNRLYDIMIYKKNCLQAPYIRLDDNQKVDIIMTEIKPVEEYKNLIPMWMKNEFKDMPINQGYIIAFSPEGRILEEGWLIFPGESILYNDCDVGHHIFYDSDSTQRLKLMDEG